jgi:hypothetical protein
MRNIAVYIRMKRYNKWIGSDTKDYDYVLCYSTNVALLVGQLVNLRHTPCHAQP